MDVKLIPGDGLKNLEKAINDLQNKVVKVGWFESAKYDDKKSTPVASVAEIQEYGSPKHNIPPRLGMREVIAKRSEYWSKIISSYSKKIINGTATVDQTLNVIGQQAQGDFKEHITQVTSPPLKPETIANRLRQRKDKITKGKLDKPLVDTGILLNTLTYVVTDDKK